MSEKGKFSPIFLALARILTGYPRAKTWLICQKRKKRKNAPFNGLSSHSLMRHDQSISQIDNISVRTNNPLFFEGEGGKWELHYRLWVSLFSFFSCESSKCCFCHWKEKREKWTVWHLIFLALSRALFMACQTFSIILLPFVMGLRWHKLDDIWPKMNYSVIFIYLLQRKMNVLCHP